MLFLIDAGSSLVRAPFLGRRQGTQQQDVLLGDLLKSADSCLRQQRWSRLWRSHHQQFERQACASERVEVEVPFRRCVADVVNEKQAGKNGHPVAVSNQVERGQHGIEPVIATRSRRCTHVGADPLFMLATVRRQQLEVRQLVELDGEMRPEAERRVGLAMVLTEVAAAENIEVSARELDFEIERLKKQYKDAATQAELDNSAWKRGLKLLWFATGKEDRLIASTKSTVEMLEKHGFKPVFIESPGGHTWLNWRNYMTEFAPQLFK